MSPHQAFEQEVALLDTFFKGISELEVPSIFHIFLDSLVKTIFLPSLKQARKCANIVIILLRSSHFGV